MNDNQQLIQQATEQLARLQRLNKQQILDRLKAMDPTLFEHLTAILFERQGFEAETVGTTGDEGVDVRLRKGTLRAVAQCKRYADSVGQPTVRDLFGTMLHNDAEEAYLVTTAQITRQARDWAFGKPIKFIDGFTLVDWVLAAQEQPKQSRFAAKRPDQSASMATAGFAQTGRNAGNGGPNSGSGNEKNPSGRYWFWPLLILGILLFGVAIGIAYTSLSSRWNDEPTVAVQVTASQADAEAPIAPAVAQSTAESTINPDATPSVAAGRPVGESGATLDATQTSTEIPPTEVPTSEATLISTATSTESPTEAPTVEPSPTPPPTIAPTATWTPESEPANEIACAIPVDAEFAGFYNAATMGCPTSQTGLQWAAWERFERGYLLWRSDTDVAYALFGLNEGTWFQISERWDNSEPPSRGTAPEGLQAPVRGFGYIWGIRDDLFEGLGWATDIEKGFCALIQSYEQGAIVQSIPIDTCTADGLFNQARSADWQPITLITSGDGRFEIR